MKTLTNFSKERMKQYAGTVAESDQKQFLTSEHTCEAGLRQMLEGVRTYCDAMKLDHGYIAGEDGYCGGYLEEILHGIRGLLSGPGRFDGGTVDSYIEELANTNKLDLP